MKDAPALIIELAMVSAMLSLILWIAWLRFGRAAHALTWSVAYGVGFLSYAANAYSNSHPHTYRAYLVLGGSIATFSMNYLWVRGYRQRAQLPLYTWRFLTALVLATVGLVFFTFFDPYISMEVAIMSIVMATLLFLAACTVLRDRNGWKRRTSIAERASAIVQFLFGCLELILMVIALRVGRIVTPSSFLIYSEILVFGLPSFYIGNGLFNVLIIASDLAGSMERLAETDTLTGLLNRRGFERAAARAIADSRKANIPLALVLADIDHFKRINDIHGHGVGDLALAHFSSYLATSLAASPAVGRLGGEEFVFLHTQQSELEAMATVESIRAKVHHIPSPKQDFKIPSFTASFGVAILEPGEAARTTDATLTDLLSRADLALYQAKATGRNRTCLFVPSMRTSDVPPADHA